MLLKVNLRLLAEGPIHLEGELPLAEFLGEFNDELVRILTPIRYDIVVEKDGEGMLLKGTIKADMECDCARCLKTFAMPLEIPDFLVVAPMEGEEAPVRDGDFADLTPFVRTDTFLALPTKPLCNPECRGLPEISTARDLHPEEKPPSASPWGPLDRLNL
jgi:uncharacterized protein